MRVQYEDGTIVTLDVGDRVHLRREIGLDQRYGEGVVDRFGARGDAVWVAWEDGKVRRTSARSLVRTQGGAAASREETP